jgi:hypothetical protein
LLALLRLLALGLALRLHGLPLRRLNALLAGDYLLALLRLLALGLALWLYGFPLCGQDALLSLYRRLAWRLRRLSRHRLLNHRLLRVLGRLLGLRLLFWLRLGWRQLRLWGRRRLWLRLLVCWRLWGRRRLRLGLRLLPGRRRLLRLRLRFWLRRRWRLLGRRLLCRRLRGRLLRRLLRAGMLRVLTAFGRRVLGHNNGPRRRRGRDAFGGEEPLRQCQRGHHRERQQGALSRRFDLQDLRQVPLPGVAAPFD